MSSEAKLLAAQIDGIEKRLQVGLIDQDDERVVANAMLINTDLFITSGQGIIDCFAAPISALHSKGLPGERALRSTKTEQRPATHNDRSMSAVGIELL